MIRQSDRTIGVTVLLEGDIPATFKGFRDYIDYYLSELRRTHGDINIGYTNPNEGSPQEVNKFKAFLRSKGVNGVGRVSKTQSNVSQSEFFPYISIDDGDRITFVDLLESKEQNETEEEAILRSQLSFESKFLQALRTIIQKELPKVHVLGEKSKLLTIGLGRDTRLSGFQFIQSNAQILLEQSDSIQAIVVVAQQDLQQKDLMAIDQLSLRGIPVIWFVDKFDISLDSIEQKGNILATHQDLNFEDYLFKLGIKISPQLIMDLQSTAIPQVVGDQGGQSKINMLPYPYHIKVAPNTLLEGYPLTTAPINMRFVAPIDTLRSRGNLKKEPLLFSSPYTQIRNAPVPMNFEFMRVKPQLEDYQNGSYLLGVEIKGTIDSYFNRRWSEEDQAWFSNFGIGNSLQEGSIHQVLISDTDVILPPRSRDGKYSAIGYNPWDRQMYHGNAQLMKNLLERLVYGHDLLEMSNRQLAIAPLDRNLWQTNKSSFTGLLLGVPMGLLLLLYVIFHFSRKRHYEKVFK